MKTLAILSRSAETSIRVSILNARSGFNFFFRAAALNLASPVRLLGPAPAPITRLQNNFRYHFQLAAEGIEPIQQLWRSVIATEKLALPKDVEYTVDVDPINLR